MIKITVHIAGLSIANIAIIASVDGCVNPHPDGGELERTRFSSKIRRS
jgi:hypothetical protein